MIMTVLTANAANRPAIQSFSQGNGAGLAFNVHSAEGATQRALSLDSKGSANLTGNLTVGGTFSSAHMALQSLKVDGIDYKDAYLSLLAQNAILQAKLDNLTKSVADVYSPPRHYWDPIARGNSDVFSDWPTRVERTNGGNWVTVASAEWYTTGVHFCSFYVRQRGSPLSMMIGIVQQRRPATLVGAHIGDMVNGRGFYDNGYVYYDLQSTDVGLPWVAADTISVELDMNAGRVRWHKNGAASTSWWPAPGPLYSFAVSTVYTGAILEMLPNTCWHKP
jgi:hypothetical protein